MSSLLKATDLFEMREEGKPGVSVREKVRRQELTSRRVSNNHN